MGEVPMPGGGMLSMPWTRMPGQTWPGVAASFLVMWIVMMAVMMLPSLVPMLQRYRLAIGGTGQKGLGPLTVAVAAGYYFVWAVFGMAVFPLGVAVVAVQTQYAALSRVVPIAVGIVVLMAGFLQLTTWKARHLAYCSKGSDSCRGVSPTAATAWRHGLLLGLHCSQCCVGLMAILLVIGVMNLPLMILVAAAITVERVASRGERIARATGIAVVAVGLLLIGRAAGLA